MNYRFTEAAIAFAGGHRVLRETVAGRGYAPWPGIDASAYTRRIERLLALYPWPIQLSQLNLLDSHDTSRLLSIAGGDCRTVELAALLLFTLFTFPGAPCVYYGDKVGLEGALPDHLVRRTFPWDAPDRWDNTLLDTYRDLIALRLAHPALRTGSYRPLLAASGAYAFLRESDDAAVLVATNCGDAPHVASLALTDLPGMSSGAAVPSSLFALDPALEVARTAERLLVDLPPRTAIVLRLPPTGAFLQT